jgi:hypothetical protein
VFEDAPSQKIRHLILGLINIFHWELGKTILLEFAQASLTMSTGEFSLDEIRLACAYLVDKGFLQNISVDEWEILREP